MRAPATHVLGFICLHMHDVGLIQHAFVFIFCLSGGWSHTGVTYRCGSFGWLGPSPHGSFGLPRVVNSLPHVSLWGGSCLLSSLCSSHYMTFDFIFVCLILDNFWWNKTPWFVKGLPVFLSRRSALTQLYNTKQYYTINNILSKICFTIGVRTVVFERCSVALISFSKHFVSFRFHSHEVCSEMLWYNAMV